MLPCLDQTPLWNSWKPLARLCIGPGGVYCDIANLNSWSICSLYTSWHVLSSGEQMLINLHSSSSSEQGNHLQQSVLWQNVWQRSPAGGGQGLCSPVRGIWEVRFLDQKFILQPTSEICITFTWTLQESQPLQFPLVCIKGLCIQESTFFFSFLWHGYYLLILTKLTVNLSCI